MVEFRQLAGDSVRLMAKLEKPSAIDFLDEVWKIDLLSGSVSVYHFFE